MEKFINSVISPDERIINRTTSNLVRTQRMPGTDDLTFKPPKNLRNTGRKECCRKKIEGLLILVTESEQVPNKENIKILCSWITAIMTV
jgi:hypothetical protein